MSHGAHTNESWHTWVMAHIRMSHVPLAYKAEASRRVLSYTDVIYMSHVTHTNESWHTYERVMAHKWTSHVAHVNALSCVMALLASVAVWSSVLQCVAVCCSVLQYVALCCTLLQFQGQDSEEVCRIYICHGAQVNESVAHMNESCRTHERVMAHKWTSHVAHKNAIFSETALPASRAKAVTMCVAYAWVMAHIWRGHGVDMNVLSSVAHGFDLLSTHMNVIYVWMSSTYEYLLRMHVSPKEPYVSPKEPYISPKEPLSCGFDLLSTHMNIIYVCMSSTYGCDLHMNVIYIWMLSTYEYWQAKPRVIVIYDVIYVWMSSTHEYYLRMHVIYVVDIHTYITLIHASLFWLIEVSFDWCRSLLIHLHMDIIYVCMSSTYGCDLHINVIYIWILTSEASARIQARGQKKKIECVCMSSTYGCDLHMNVIYIWILASEASARIQVRGKSNAARLYATLQRNVIRFPLIYRIAVYKVSYCARM